MGTTERRERERLETRTKIMDAARDLFAREGYEAVSMRRIADAIEYSPTTIYVHFKDKQDLLLSICRADFAAFGHMLGELQSVQDPVERIRRMGHAYIRFGVQHPNHYRLMFMTKIIFPDGAVADDARHGKVDADGYALLKLSVRQAIDQGRVRPEYCDPDLLAQTFWATVHGVASLQITKADDPWIEWAGLERLAEAAIDSILRGATVAGPTPASPGRVGATPAAPVGATPASPAAFEPGVGPVGATPASPAEFERGVGSVGATLVSPSSDPRAKGDACVAPTGSTTGSPTSPTAGSTAPATPATREARP